MPKVEYTPLALEDLLHICYYFTTSWDENVAKKILKKITSDINRLENYPLSGVNLGSVIDVPTEYRYLFSEKNYVFYHLESDKVRIIRILSQQQNYLHQLFEISPEADGR